MLPAMTYSVAMGSAIVTGLTEGSVCLLSVLSVLSVLLLVVLVLADKEGRKI